MAFRTEQTIQNIIIKKNILNKTVFQNLLALLFILKSQIKRQKIIKNRSTCMDLILGKILEVHFNCQSSS